jgi:hypothetical protein
MYTLIRTLPTRELFWEQFFAFAISLMIAEVFYKFHSFTLECIAFLLTWYVLDFLIGLVRKSRPK